MKLRIQHTLLALALLSTLNPQLSASPLGTAFTYQGRLNDTGQPATGIYDLRFTIYDAGSGGSVVAGPVTNSTTGVTNGLFNTTLDFGAGVFNSNARWLEISVRTNGGGAFTTLIPRQPVTPTPYALYVSSAGSVAASNLVGTIPDARIATNVARLDAGGRLPDTTLSTNVALLNSSPGFSGTVTASAFSGNGSALTNLNATSLTSGTIPDTRLAGAYSSAVSLTNSSNSFAGIFTGNGGPLTNLNASYLNHGVLASDRLWGAYSNALTFNNRSNSFTGDGSGLTNLNASSLTSGLIPSGRLQGTYSSTLMLTSSSNRYWGKFIGDGSMLTNFSYTFNSSNFAGNGYFLTSLNADNIGYGTIADEHLSNNIVRSGSDPNFHDVNAGGNVQANGNVVAAADLLGGRLNVGIWHVLGGNLSSIAGGQQNTITNADYAFIGGGIVNSILDGNRSADGNCSVIAGGSSNLVSPSNYCSTISGGAGNSIGEGNYCSTIGGGSGNSIQTNAISSTIGGGSANSIQTNATYSTIGGGYLNTVNHDVSYATIPGGYYNEVGGSYSFAAGFRAHALNDYTFVWSDGWTTNFTSTDNRQFLIQAFHGVGINTNNPQADLHVNGTVKATTFSGSFNGTFSGNGAGITNIVAGSLSVSNADLLDGHHGVDFALLNSSPTFSGTVTAAAFAGNGSGLTGLNADNLASGTVPDARLNINVARLNSSPIFSGTVTANADLKASRLNIGSGNISLGQSSTIAGGANNANAGAYSAISGGADNTIAAYAVAASIPGGSYNAIGSAYDSTIGGGQGNTIGTDAHWAMIGGGIGNTIGTNASYSMIIGGVSNQVTACCSFAGGYMAKALHYGTFVWSDWWPGEFSSTDNYQFLIRAHGGVGINTNNTHDFSLFVRGNSMFDGDFYVKTLVITGGSDVAEPFEMSTEKIAQGAVVVIDEASPGRLRMSDCAYDTKVAGVVSGANGINPGISLNQEGLAAGGQNVALSGRVYALADASNGPIQPGDLLTTSATPGHAMKVSNHVKAQGAILGKAMSSLKGGRGMVLVLVSLQ